MPFTDIRTKTSSHATPHDNCQGCVGRSKSPWAVPSVIFFSNGTLSVIFSYNLPSPCDDRSCWSCSEYSSWGPFRAKPSILLKFKCCTGRKRSLILVTYNKPVFDHLLLQGLFLQFRWTGIFACYFHMTLLSYRYPRMKKTWSVLTDDRRMKYWNLNGISLPEFLNTLFVRTLKCFWRKSTFHLVLVLVLHNLCACTRSLCNSELWSR